MRRISLGGEVIDDDSPCFVIAEVGNNHMGDLETCKNLFRAAKDCGCSAVKLQKRDNVALFTRAAYDMPYENRNSFGPTYGTHRDFLEFGLDQYRELKRFCEEELDIIFFATPFDVPSADFLAEVDIPIYKIASGDLTNTVLIEHVARLGKPIIMSTGGGSMDDVRRAYETAARHVDQICIMQCTSGYPPAFDQLDLRVIQTYRDAFPEAVIGYSGHENGIAIAVAAYTLGARVIEKHFTLDRTWKGTDQALSLAPTGMRKMVRDLARTHVALGDGVKKVHSCEAEPLKKMAKSLVAARPLRAGQALAREDIAVKVPSGGLPPYRLDEVLGRKLDRDLQADDPLSLDLLS